VKQLTKVSRYGISHMGETYGLFGINDFEKREIRKREKE
jgi:hypothetical protein